MSCFAFARMLWCSLDHNVVTSGPPQSVIDRNSDRSCPQCNDHLTNYMDGWSVYFLCAQPNSAAG